MNLLPFILIILALFATLSSSLLTKGRSLALEHKAYKSYMDAERFAKAAIIKTAYAKIPVPKTDAEKKEGRALSLVKNWRQQNGKLKKARLNIYALLHDNDPPPYLTQTFLSLMNELYTQLPIYLELQAEGRLTAFFEKWKGCENISDISYDDPDFTLLFYKMCKGCTCYDTESVLGYPPLDDFIHISKLSANKPMPWRLARPPLLRAYFGHLTSSILTLEAEKQIESPSSQSTLNREELDQLLQTHPDIPKHLLNDAVGNTSDAEVIGTSELTKVRHTPL